MELGNVIPTLVVWDVCYIFHILIFIKFKAWIGLISNNYVELQALRLLLNCAKD